MADKKDNTDDIFDFDSADWAEEEEGLGTSAGDDDPFGESSLGKDVSFGSDGDEAEDAPFASMSDSGGDDQLVEFQDEGFGVVADDPFGDDDPFNVQDMPTPGSTPDPSSFGNPDEEFADLETDDEAPSEDAFAEADGFNSGDDLFMGDEEPEEPGAGSAEEDEIEDVFADGSEDEDTYEPAAEKSNERSGLSKLIFPAAAAAAAVGAAYVGYTTLLPMFSGPGQQPPIVSVQPDNVPAFPSALPGQEGGLQLPEAIPSDRQPLPQTPSQLADGADRASSGVPDTRVQSGADTDGLLLPPLPGPVAGGTPVTASEDGLSLPSIEDEIVAGGRDGGIDALRGPEAGPLPQVEAPEPTVTPAGSELVRRIERIEERLEVLDERISEIALRQPSAPAAAQAEEADGAAKPAASELAPAELGDLVPPLKPLVIESANLKGVSRDTAWVSTSSGVVEVKAGDSIPGGGKVVKIVEYEGDWIVVTTDGIVVR